jgi:ATP-binding cassette subfamily F protein 2
MAGELRATKGDVKPHPQLLIGRYNQHSAEQLDPEKRVFDFFKSTYPNSPTFKVGGAYRPTFTSRYTYKSPTQLCFF